MQILIVRHAIAVERGTPGYEDDARRPLTEKGVRRMTRTAEGIARMVPACDSLFTSPLLRARQTADVLSKAWGGKPRPEVATALAPGRGAAEVARWLSGFHRQDVVAVVGHEPDLSLLLAHLVAPGGSLSCDFRKGGAALVEADRIRGGLSGTLLWFAGPRLLRAAAR